MLGVALAPVKLPKSALTLGLALPWLKRRSPARGRPVVLEVLLPRIAVDGAALAGMLRASLRERILVL